MKITRIAPTWVISNSDEGYLIAAWKEYHLAHAQCMAIGI